MSGFSPEWLSLREPCDHRARNPKILGAAVAALTGREHISVADLACGTGSNLRALAPHLGERQTWRLVDRDSGLLAAAREALIAFADEVRAFDPLILRKGGRLVEVNFLRLDLRYQLTPALDGSIDLVTAAAFFDLVSPAWIGGFCAELRNRKLPLYTTLNCAGDECWRPSHPADAAMLAAFHAHQAIDKGFGPAAGSQAAPLLARTLNEFGFSVRTGKSPWRLDSANASLIAAHASGVAKAVSETGLVPEAVVADWRAARMSAAECEVAHIDLLATIPKDHV